MFNVGNVVAFVYNGKNRHVRVEKVKNDVVTGWDFNANKPFGGYRSFSVVGIKNPVLISKV